MSTRLIIAFALLVSTGCNLQTENNTRSSQSDEGTSSSTGNSIGVKLTASDAMNNCAAHGGTYVDLDGQGVFMTCQFDADGPDAAAFENSVGGVTDNGMGLQDMNPGSTETIGTSDGTDGNEPQSEPEEAVSGWPSGLTHGNYCGPQNGNGGTLPTTDELDKCCENHDSCLAGVPEWLDPDRRVLCEMTLCACAMGAETTDVSAKTQVTAYACTMLVGNICTYTVVKKITDTGKVVYVLYKVCTAVNSAPME